MENNVTKVNEQTDYSLKKIKNRITFGPWWGEVLSSESIYLHIPAYLLTTMYVNFETEFESDRCQWIYLAMLIKNSIMIYL